MVLCHTTRIAHVRQFGKLALAAHLGPLRALHHTCINLRIENCFLLAYWPCDKFSFWKDIQASSFAASSSDQLASLVDGCFTIKKHRCGLDCGYFECSVVILIGHSFAFLFLVMAYYVL